MTTIGNRTSEHEIDPMFLERWSPRAFTGEAIPEGELMSILEAARWAPSSYNSQPWRMVWARRDTPHWAPMLSLLIEFNQSWAKDAAALVVIASSSTMIPPGKTDPVPSHSHSFDAGSAWASLSFQALKMGWHTHGMVGFDMERAFAELGFPAGHRVEAAIAIGRKGDRSSLPEQMAAREEPSPRKPLAETMFEGRFKG